MFQKKIRSIIAITTAFVIAGAGATAWALHETPTQRMARTNQRGQASKLRGLASPVSGIVSKVYVKAGDYVQKGQVLAQLNDRKAKLQLMQAHARVAMAMAKLQAADTAAKEAATRFERARALFKTNVMSEEEFSAIRFARDKLMHEVNSHKAEVEFVKIAVELAEYDVASHRIISPASGYIRMIHKQAGEGIEALHPIVTIEVSEKKK